jgi:pimeloyl-ACP methyl ester carboxylesterase
VTLQYVEHGDATGIPLILLHAIADSWHSFERVLPYLPASIHAFALTQRGHGDASRPGHGYRPNDFAADLKAFMDAVQVSAAVIVAGSSGGFAARRFAIDYPRRIRGLVLLGSPAMLRNKPEVLDIWNTTLSKLSDPIDPVFVRGFAESTMAQPVPREFVETMVRENLKVPARVWKETMKGLLEDDSFDDLRKITAPTRIIWGDRDAFLPRQDQEKLLSAIPGARLIVYHGAGHALYWEEPRRIATDLAAFVKDVIR